MSPKMTIDEIVSFVREKAVSQDYREFMLTLAKQIIDIDNTPDQPLEQIAANENKVLDILRKAINNFANKQISTELVPIDPEIAKHPYYTNPYYCADENHPDGLPAEQAYKNRFNLFAIVNPQIKSQTGKPVILNAHIDTVAPFFPCKIDEKYIHGRGACDDKGLVVMLIASMKLIAEIEEKIGLVSAKRVYQFVIEEETGGNGSLSAERDKRFAGWETIVCEATEFIPHPANRGAMWFKLEMNTKNNINTLDIIPFVILELTAEGRKLREESNLELFPKEYVQVNLGTLNSFGRHPSAVNDYFSVIISPSQTPNDKLDEQELHQVIQTGITKYCKIYGDKTTEDELKQHYVLTKIDSGFKLEIFGLGGHMSALLMRDNALTKAGFILSELIMNLRQEKKLQFDIISEDKDFNPSHLELTGGVGFTPVHKMSDLQLRLNEAVKRGIQNFNEITGLNIGTEIFRMSFDMLHNEAYASPVDCPAMKAFEWAHCKEQIAFPKPIAFRASCDARIYANSGHNTVTFGPGHLKDAHSEQEKLSIEELQKGLEMITLATIALITGEYESNCK